MNRWIVRQLKATRWLLLALRDYIADGMLLVLAVIRECREEGNRGHHDDLGL